MRILIACEYSGIVRDAFRGKWHDAWSCDILPGQWDTNYHLQCDVFDIINDWWDMIIAHPPCTYLCKAQLWKCQISPDRELKRLEAIEFVKMIQAVNCEKICIENPIWTLSKNFRKPDMIIYAYQLWEIYSKDICLWTKNLPKLRLDPEKEFKGKTKRLDFHSKNRYSPEWHSKKSKTFQGLADIMAEQWG